MGEFFSKLIGTIITYFIMWCVIAFIYWIITIMFGLTFNPNVVWTIVGIIFILDLLVTAGKKVDDL